MSVGHRRLKSAAHLLELVRYAPGRLFATVARDDKMRRTNFHPGLNLFVLFFVFFVRSNGGRWKDSRQ